MFFLNLQIITVNFKSQMVIQHVIVRITKLCSYVNRIAHCRLGYVCPWLQYEACNDIAADIYTYNCIIIR